MPRVVHFDLSAEDPKRAAEFYRRVFGWTIEKWEGPDDYWLVRTGKPDEPGIDGGLAKRVRPSDSTTNFVAVSSIDEYLERVTSHGGSAVEPKHSIPGVGYMAVCRDTENNVFGMLEEDATAS